MQCKAIKFISGSFPYLAYLEVLSLWGMLPNNSTKRNNPRKILVNPKCSKSGFWQLGGETSI